MVKSTEITTADILQEIKALNGQNTKLVNVENDPEFNANVTKAIETMRNAILSDSSASNAPLGDFNRGIILTKKELESILGANSLPADFEGLLICLALHHSDNPIGIPDVNGKPVEAVLHNILFPVITVVKTDGIVPGKFTPSVPGCVDTGGILCPPLPQCPPKGE